MRASPSTAACVANSDWPSTAVVVVVVVIVEVLSGISSGSDADARAAKALGSGAGMDACTGASGGDCGFAVGSAALAVGASLWLDSCGP